MVHCYAFLLHALLFCGASYPSAESATDRAVVSADTLPLEAYLVALDSSAQHVRPYARRVLVLLQDTAVQIPVHELRARALIPTRSAAVCGDDAVLVIQRPSRALGGGIVLQVDEKTHRSGLAGGYAYIFDCVGGACRLRYAVPSDRDVVVGCPHG
jgi:hypothetical protein